MFNTLKEVRWGIIGVGDVCEVKSGPAFQKIENSSLVAVMRRNGEKAADFAKRHGVPKWYDDADKLINDPDVNAIYIATPPGSHADYTFRAAKAGKPVYVEKPMARSTSECQAMVDACKQAGVPLFIAYYRRMLPNFLKVKSLIESGVIGEVRYVNVKLNKPLHPDIVGAAHDPDNWRIFPEVAGGGYFYDLGCHQLDILDFLLGPVKHAHGYAANQGGIYPAEDIVTGSFVFESGVLGQGTWCFATSDASDEEVTTIIGSKGEISFPYFSDHSVTLKVEGKPAERMTFDIPKHIQQPLIQTIVDELTGTGKCPSTGVSGTRTNWVMEQLSKRVDR
ncbi:MAG: Gfo/Idh/MocA family oxidoreductase [Imperialibacter sp.]